MGALGDALEAAQQSPTSLMNILIKKTPNNQPTQQNPYKFQLLPQRGRHRNILERVTTNPLIIAVSNDFVLLQPLSPWDMAKDFLNAC